MSMCIYFQLCFNLSMLKMLRKREILILEERVSVVKKAKCGKTCHSIVLELVVEKERF